MSSRSSLLAVQDIRSWSVHDVLTNLKKNGLEDCCDACRTREIDGDNLLNLTEGRLALWRRDLQTASIKKLLKFVNDLNATPESYVVNNYSGKKNSSVKNTFNGNKFQSAPNAPKTTSHLKPLPSLPARPPTPLSDADSFDSEYENTLADDPLEDNLYLNHPAFEPEIPRKPTLSSKPALQFRTPGFGGGTLPPKPVTNGAYNVINSSALHGKSFDMPKPPMPHLEQLIGNLNLPSVNDDEEYFEDEYESIEERPHPRDAGFLENPPSLVLPPRNHRPNSPSQVKLNDEQNARKPFLPPLPGGRSRAVSPPYPKHTFNKQHSTGTPLSGGSRAVSPFSGVSNRPPIPVPTNGPGNQGSPYQGDSSFNNIPAGIPNIMSGFRHRNISQSQHAPNIEVPPYSSNSSNSFQSSNEQVNKHFNPPSSTTDLSEDEGEEYEEVIEGDPPPFATGSEYYLPPVQCQQKQSSPTLPRKPRAVPQNFPVPLNKPPSPPRKMSSEIMDTEGNKVSDLLRVALANRKLSGGPSPEIEQREKSPTPELQKSSLFEQKTLERPQYPTSQRPLPPPPDPSRKAATEPMAPRKTSRGLSHMPWYHNVDRKRAEEMLKNGEDGRFVLRPSLQTQNQLTLTLWYKKRLYNIGVRLRPDQRYSLGTEKAKELSFSSVEELVQFYQGEELVLFSAGERAGKTLLTTSPPRQPN